MRHFLRSARSPGPLPGSVQTRSGQAQLVAFTGAAQRLTPADLGALTRAVQVQGQPRRRVPLMSTRLGPLENHCHLNSW